MLLKIGELAKQTGLTIRALRHYDDIGLLSPSIRSDAGYRLYGQADVARLHGIQALKQLGLDLDLAGIGDLLDIDTRWPALVLAVRRLMADGVAADHPSAQARAREWTELLERRVGGDPALLVKLHNMTLAEPVAQAQTGIDGPVIDYITAAIAATRAGIYARYLTPAEMERVQRNRSANAAQWPPLIAAMRDEMAAASAPDKPAVRALARQWQQLFEASFSGGDPALQIKLREVFQREPELMRGTGLDPALLDFVRRAMVPPPA